MKNGKFLDKLLLILGVFLLAFIITMIIIFCIKDSVPDTLIEKVLDGATWEAGFAGMITVAKFLRKKNDSTSGNDIDNNGMEDDV